MFDWFIPKKRERPLDDDPPKLALLRVDQELLALHNCGAKPLRHVRVDTDRSDVHVLNPAPEPFDLAPGESWTMLTSELESSTEAVHQLTITCDVAPHGISIPVPFCP